MSVKKMQWDWEIKPLSSWLELNIRELLAYKDLLFRLVRKEFLLRYQQTLLGPVWVIIQPVLTVIMYVLIFNRILGLSTMDAPPILFYLTGITLWNLFSDIFLGTASTFVLNAEVFGKVYFPRLIAPLSVMFLHCIRFLIQLGLLFIILLYYYLRGDVALPVSTFLIFIPVVVVTALMALGGGLIFSVITAKYRDLSNLLSLIVSLLMFACPIFYSLAFVPEKVQWVVNINPLSSLFELFRYAFLGKGEISFGHLVYSLGVMIVIVTGGFLLFNKKGDELMDVV